MNIINMTMVSLLMMSMSMISLMINYRNLMTLLLTIELLLLSICLLLSTFSYTPLLPLSTMMMMQILTIAASETAMGLSMIISYYRIRGTMGMKSFFLLRG